MAEQGRFDGDRGLEMLEQSRFHRAEGDFFCLHDLLAAELVVYGQKNTLCTAKTVLFGHFETILWSDKVVFEPDETICGVEMPLFEFFETSCGPRLDWNPSLPVCSGP